jgi:hypothetical protein
LTGLKKNPAFFNVWNAGLSLPLNPAYVLRLMYEEKINGNKEINSLLERISQLDREIHNFRILLEETESGWKEAA